MRDVYKLNFGKVSTTNQINERKVLRSACRCAASWLRCAAGAAGDVRGLVGRGELVALRAGDARGLVGRGELVALRGAGGAMLLTEGF